MNQGESNRARREVIAHFAQVDANGDHRIDRAEFVELMRNLDADMEPAELEIGFAAIDSDHDGLISCDEFRAWWLEE